MQNPSQTSLNGRINQTIQREPMSSSSFSKVVSRPGLNEGIAMASSIEESSPSTDPLSEAVDIYLQQAQAYADERQWEKAIRACQDALELSPTAQAYRLWGNILQRQGNTLDAMGYYAKALTLAPESAEIFLNMGSLYARRQEWARAVEYLQKALQHQPDLALAHWNLARVWQKQGNIAAEMQSLARALELQPDLGNGDDHYRVGTFFEQEGKVPEAIRCYRRATEQEPTLKKAFQRLAHLLEDQGEWEEAVDCYRKVLDLNGAAAAQNPNPSPQQKRLKGTSALFTKTLPGSSPLLNLSDKNRQLLQGLLTQSSQKKLLQPPGKLLNAMGANPPQPQAVDSEPKQMSPPSEGQNGIEPQQVSVKKLVERAGRAVVAKNWPLAIQCFQLAIQQSPQSAELYRKLAVVFSRNQQPLESAQTWYKVFSMEPDRARADQYVQVGDVLAQHEKFTAAEVCYRQAIRKQSNYVEAYHRLGRVLRSQNKTAAAQALMQQLAKLKSGTAKAPSPDRHSQQPSALKLEGNPTNDQTRQNTALEAHKRGQILQEKKQWQEAMLAYRQSIELYPDFCWSHNNLADCCRQLERWDEAAVAYRRSIELNPEFVWSYYHLGGVLLAQKDWEAAIEVLLQAQHLSEDKSVIAHRLVEAYEQWLSQQPRNLDRYEALVEQQLLAGKLDEAIATLQMALQIEPGHGAIALKLADLLADQDPDQAQRLKHQAQLQTYDANLGTPADLMDVDYAKSVLEHTALFDQAYYQRNYPDASGTNPETGKDLSPLEHYIQTGVEQGLNPNPLFDTSFYLQQYQDVARLGVNPLAHYHLFGFRGGRDPHPFFSTQHYLEQHSDISAAQINPLEHYLTAGAKQGRVAFTAERLKPLLQSTIPAEAPYLDCWRSSRSLPPVTQKLTLGVYCSTAGNYFMTEIADWLTAALRHAGHDVLQLTEQETPPQHLDQHIVVAPHDFFYLGDGPQRVRQSPELSRAIMINVEQPQTNWFSRAFHYLRQAAMVFDINVKSAAFLQGMGLPAYWLPIGYLPDYSPLVAPPSLDNLPAIRNLPQTIKQHLPALDAPLKERPLDLHFIGRLSARREQFFQQNPWLQQYQSFLHTPPPGLPLKPGDEQALDMATAVGLSRRSKILLHIHQDELPYFTWHRMAFHGFWQNTLIVTEPCHELMGLTPGEHFVACEPEQLATQVRYLLTTPEGQSQAEQIRRAGHINFQQRFNGVKLISRALALITRKPGGGM